MSFAQFTHVTFGTGVVLVCLVLAVYVSRKKRKDPKTARILVGILLTEMLFNAADTWLDYGREKFAGDQGIIEETPDFLVFVFLYVFIAFLAMYILKILSLREAKKTERDKLVQRIINLLCAAGTLLILFYQIFDAAHGTGGRNSVLWVFSFGVLLLFLQISFALLLALVLFHRRDFRLMEFKVFLFITVALLLAPVLQVTFYGFAVFNVLTFITAFLCTVVYLWEVSKHTKYQRDIALTDENIAMLTEEFDAFLKEMNVGSRMAIRVTFKMEESLLRMRETYGETAKVDFYAVVAFGRPQIRISMEGEPFNPLAQWNEAEADWSMEMLRGTTVSPRYSYFAGKNYVRLSMPQQKTNPTLQMLTGILAGLALGAAAKLLMSAQGMDAFENYVLYPAYELLISILSCAAGPVIFFMVINTILNTGAMSRQGVSSGNIVGRYFLLSGGMATLAVMLVCLTELDLVKMSRPGSTEILQFEEYITDLIPDDVFAPITQANTPQLLLLAFVLGCAVVATGTRGSDLTGLLRQVNLAGMRIAEWIGRLVPYFAVLIVAYAVIGSRMSTFTELGILLLEVTAISSLCAAGAIACVSCTKKVKIRIILRKCSESLKHAFITGSAYTAYEFSEKCSIRELGVRKSFARASLPLGTVLYMPANAIGAVVFIAFAEVASDQYFSPLWLCAAIVLSVILIAATPPIPGANCLAYMMVISVMGIDQKFIIIALLFDILFSSFSTAVNQLMLQMELVMQADRAGMLDRDRLAGS